MDVRGAFIGVAVVIWHSWQFSTRSFMAVDFWKGHLVTSVDDVIFN